ncbi:GatB/YqeY domain-containing protein [bacterium]|nr:GatB/YqeY domain-containing protein [bacterium]
MNLLERIGEDIKTAMKAKDQVRLDTLRMLKSDLNNVRIDKKSDLTDEDILAVIQKSVKKRQDSIEAYTSGGRADLADKETQEMEILKGFLPEQMSESDIQALVKAVIAETGASSKRDMGKVMGALMPKVKGRADGKLVQQAVSALLP